VSGSLPTLSSVDDTNASTALATDADNESWRDSGTVVDDQIDDDAPFNVDIDLVDDDDGGDDDLLADDAAAELPENELSVGAQWARVVTAIGESVDRLYAIAPLNE
jgi:hypothetical protein